MLSKDVLGIIHVLVPSQFNSSNFSNYLLDIIISSAWTYTDTKFYDCNINTKEDKKEQATELNTNMECV